MFPYYDIIKYILKTLTFLNEVNTPYGKFSIEKSESDEYSINDFMIASVL